ncbi:MAG: hypothetical protein ACI81T_001997 [Bacteroidia bacterium]|jgi:hypothetical protein
MRLLRTQNRKVFKLDYLRLLFGQFYDYILTKMLVNEFFQYFYPMDSDFPMAIKNLCNCLNPFTVCRVEILLCESRTYKTQTSGQFYNRNILLPLPKLQSEIYGIPRKTTQTRSVGE